MVRIKITDLPKDKKIPPTEMRNIMGGASLSFDPTMFTRILGMAGGTWASTTGPTCEWRRTWDRGKIPAGAEPYI